MPSTNCQRHAGARKGEGTLTKTKKNKPKRKPAQLLARKKRDFKPSVWLFPLRATGSFYSALPRGGTEVFIGCCQGSKHQINGIEATPQGNSEVLGLLVAGQAAPSTARAALGCQQLLKVAGCRVQYSWRLLCTRALPANLPADRKCLSHQPRAPSNAVTLETNILKIWGKKKKIPSSHLPQRNKPVPHPSPDTRALSHQ